MTLVVAGVLEDRRVDRGRQHRADLDPAAAQLLAQCQAEPDDAELRGRVGAEVRHRDHAGDRGVVDEHPAALRPELADGGPSAVDVPEQVGLDHAPEVRRRDVLERAGQVGGGAQTAELTLPGFRHDLCSAFHPLALAGPISDLPLTDHGLTWCHAERPYAGATPDGPGVALERCPERSAALFDRARPGDGRGWRALFGWWAWGGQAVRSLFFNPLGNPTPILRAAPLLAHPRCALQLGQLMTGSARAMVERAFDGEDARVWLTGTVAHSDLSPDDAGGGAFGLMLCGLAQQVGMPIPRCGAQAIADALARLLAAHGGRILTGERARQIVVRGGRAVGVRTATTTYDARRAVVATVQPQALFLDLVGAGHLPPDFVKLVRRFRWGTGVYTLHCALDRPPTFRAEALRGAPSFHLGRSLDAIAEGVTAALNGALPQTRPDDGGSPSILVETVTVVGTIRSDAKHSHPRHQPVTSRARSPASRRVDRFGPDRRHA